MMNHPVDQRIFEPNIPASLLGFKPLVFENFLALDQKRAIQRRSRQEVGIACLSHQIIGLGENTHTILIHHQARDFSARIVPFAHTRALATPVVILLKRVRAGKVEQEETEETEKHYESQSSPAFKPSEKNLCFLCCLLFNL